MAHGREGVISAYCFSIGSSIILLPVVFRSITFLNYFINNYWIFSSILFAILVNVYFFYQYTGESFSIAIRGGNLGVVFGVCLGLWFEDSTFNPFFRYFVILSFFHWSEYFITALLNPKDLSLSSYLLNHSVEYHVAAYVSWLEFLVEAYYFPWLKNLYVISWIGLILVLGGEFVRKYAMYTAGQNFSHYIRHSRQIEHQLVTSGIYSWFRHPSYVGWFYWSIGTQVLLINPICALLYTVLSWKFFQRRILEEEMTLLRFFCKDYYSYQLRTPTGLPFIKGFVTDIYTDKNK